MKMYIFESAFDNVVDEATSFDVSWPDLVELFSEHRETERKNEWGFVLASFNTNPVTAEPAVTNRGTADEVIHFGTVGRVAANLIAVDAVCLDFDGGVTITEIVERLESINLRHLGYTSFNHQNPTSDQPQDKFRIVIPLETPCPKNEWRLRRHSIVEELFPEADHSCVSLARIFYFPAHPPGGKERALSWHMDGDALDWRDLPAREVQTPPEPRAIPTVKGGHGKVVFKTFDAVRFMQDQGLYIRPAGGTKHEVICPNCHQHTGGTVSGTVLYQDGTNWPNFYCAHGHCRDFDFYAHFKAKLGKSWMVPYCEREPELKVSDLVARFMPKEQQQGENKNV